MKRLLAAVGLALAALSAHAQMAGGIMESQRSLFTSITDTGLSATAVVCTDASKVLTSTCSSAAPAFAATTVTTLTAINAATQDAMRLAGRAGGTGNFIVTLSPTTLTGNRAVTFPDAATSIPIATQFLTFSGPTAARTITLPDAAFTAARTDASNTFTGAQTITCATGGCAGYNAVILNGTTTGGSVLTGSNTSGSFKVGVEDTTGGGAFGGTTAAAAIFVTSANKPVQIASNNAVQASITTNGLNLATTAANQLRTTQAAVPTVTTNGGTSPSCVGADTFMICTIGTSPPAAATFTVTFSGTWGAAPSCIALRGTAGASPLVQNAVTATGTVQVNLSANLVASEKYHIHCGGIS